MVGDVVKVRLLKVALVEGTSEEVVTEVVAGAVTEVVAGAVVIEVIDVLEVCVEAPGVTVPPPKR